MKLGQIFAASLLLLLYRVIPTIASCIPLSGCTVALANYIISSGDTVADIATTFQTSITSIQTYNQLSDVNSISLNQALSIPFTCGCTDDYLGYDPFYTITAGDTIDNVVHTKFGNLSQTQWVLSANSDVNPNNLTPGSIIRIPLNCSCGDPDVSLTYGLFLTYVVQSGDTLTSLSQKFDVEAELLTKYNQNVNMNQLVAYTDIIYVPAKDGTGVYPAYNVSAGGQSATHPGSSKAAIIGGSVGGAVILVMVLGLILFWRTGLAKKEHSSHKQESTLLTGQSQVDSFDSSFAESGESIVEFSYNQLEAVTDNFSLSKKIGAGGFGTVYYAEIHNKRVAIKMMDITETTQFKAEVQVLARIHHTNLVELVGWCTERALFLVYEFVENGTLRSHLEGPQNGGTPLTWASRVQIALDSARGLEYIHEYTVPSYVHRDIKPDNILLNNSLQAKVADFGLAKLGEITGTTKNAGTRGYMAPEYALGGILSPKVDVFAFGIVLMQLISARGPIVYLDGGSRQSLPSLFEDFLKDPQAKEKLSSFVDPTLEASVLQDERTRNSVWKITQLACECTAADADDRPDMRNVVTILTGLISSQDWALRAFSVQTNKNV